MQENRFEIEAKSVRDRIKLAMRQNRITENSVAKGDSSAQSRLNSQISHGKKITLDTVLRIVDALPGISPRWLLTGEGSMLSEDVQNSAASPQLIPSETGIPMIPLDAMAGAFAGEVQIMDYECERYVVPGMQRADFLIPVKGDSMLPSYSPGDIVACVRVPLSDVFFQWGRVYVLDTAQGAIIKRVRKSASPSEIMIFSDNADKYEPFPLPVSEIHSLALVIGLIRLE